MQSSESWAPVGDMPGAFATASLNSTGSCVEIVLLPEVTANDVCSRRLHIRFEGVIAYAVYDDLLFSVSDIEDGSHHPCSILRGSEWPVPHERLRAAGYDSVTHYRIVALDAILDILSRGPVHAYWNGCVGDAGSS